MPLRQSWSEAGASGSSATRRKAVAISIPTLPYESRAIREICKHCAIRSDILEDSR